MFQNLLISLNPTSGNRMWWLIYILGMSLVLGWLFMALPWLDLFLDGALGVGQYGSRKLIAMIAYGNELPNRTTDYYFLSVFLGILVLQFGVQLMRVGESFAKGQTFLNGRWSYPPL